MRKLLVILLAMVVVVGVSATAFAATTSSYTDVATTHWAYSSIESCKTRGLMRGAGNNQFAPESTLTRAQVAQICYNAYQVGITGETDKTLADVASGAWHYDAMYWMFENGIINGTAQDNGETKCYPDATAERKYVALVLYRLANKLEVTLPKSSAAVTFPDIVGLGNEYQEAIGALQQAGVISGFPDGTYQPDGLLTRAQAAKLFGVYTDIEGLGLTVTGDPPVAEPPLSSEVFLSKAVYDEIKPYAESLGYMCDSFRDPVNNAWQMTFSKHPVLVAITLFPDTTYWRCIAYESYGIGSPDRSELYNLDEMKSVLEQYAD